MKLGFLLHAAKGVDYVYDEARRADRQGFDSLWLFDHLLDHLGREMPDQPLDSFTLMCGVGTITNRAKLAWAMLNLSFRRPTVLAKSLATLDQMTHGRVLATVGSGWLIKEYEAYDIPLVADHDERIQYAREAIQLMKQLWANPAPAKTNFNGKFLKTKDLPFNPAPYQKNIPVWFGGDSDASLNLVKELGEGWVMLKSGTKERLGEIMGAKDWPKKPMAVMKNARIHVAPTHKEALAEAEKLVAAKTPGMHATVEEFVAKEVVGTPDECIAKLAEMQSWGLNQLRVDCMDFAHQERIATLLIPRLGEVDEKLRK